MTKSIIRLTAVIAIITGLAFWTCHQPKEQVIYVAISKYIDNDHYNQYQTWLNTVDTNIVLIDMYHLPLDSALLMLEKCSGLLMSGGADVHPAFYQQTEDTILCEIDGYRDTLEMALLKRASELHLPVLGICRGLQIMNVYMGGSLYPDLPERFGTHTTHRAKERSFDCSHKISLVEGSLLMTLTGTQHAEVNSSHHQGIDKLAPGLAASAFSPDTLIEAIEPEDPKSLPFFMAVQWHPERLSPEHPMSGPLATKFIDAVRIYYHMTLNSKNKKKQ